MRPSLHETAAISEYLLKEMTDPDKAVFETKMILSPELRTRVGFQQKALQLVRWFGRHKKRETLEHLHQKLMQDPAFRATIQAVFS